MKSNLRQAIIDGNVEFWEYSVRESENRGNDLGETVIQLKNCKICNINFY